MRVAVFPSDDGGCGWYRIRFVAHELIAQGHDVVINPEEMGFWRDGDGNPVSVDLDADVAVVQRVTRRITVDFVATLKNAGHRVIVDVDDDLDALHPNHPYRTVLDGDTRSADNLHAACELADLVTCTTQPLADRYAPHGRYAILPNLVPREYLRVKARRRGPLRVGWTGKPSSHLDDALVMGGKVGPVVADAGARFCAWGQSADVTFRQVGVPAGARVTVPHRPLRSGYPASVAELSVGLVPLQDSPFNRAKSWLKGIESAALGVPFVASPLPEYVKLHGLGVGLLAGSPEEWVEHVGRLLGSPSERAELAEAGRAVMAGLCYEDHAHRWWDAWTGTGVDGDLPASAMVGGAGVAAPTPA